MVRNSSTIHLRSGPTQVPLPLLLDTGVTVDTTDIRHAGHWTLGARMAISTAPGN